MIFRYLWLIILGLIYIIWTVKSFSDGIKCFKRNIRSWKYGLFDWDEDLGAKFVTWLVFNGAFLFIASLWYFMVG